MDQVSLPIVKVPYVRLNPDWVGEYVDGKCVNMDSRKLPEAMLDAQVLSLHISTGKMRVRLLEKQPCHFSKSGLQALTIDVSISHFFDQFQITAKA